MNGSHLFINPSDLSGEKPSSKFSLIFVIFLVPPIFSSLPEMICFLFGILLTEMYQKIAVDWVLSGRN